MRISDWSSDVLFRSTHFAALADNGVRNSAHDVTPGPALRAVRRSGRGLSEFGCAGQPVQAEDPPRVIGLAIAAVDEVRVTSFDQRAGRQFVFSQRLLLEERTLAEQLVDRHRDVTAGLAHDPPALALSQPRPLALEEMLADIGRASCRERGGKYG